MFKPERYHIRVSVTPQCNFRCLYCNPQSRKEHAPLMDDHDLIEFLTAASDLGIKRVHWTGGEPTIKSNLIDLIRTATTLGFTQQIMTTNGSLFYRLADDLKNAGLTRVNISLDTLKPVLFNQICGLDIFDRVLESITKAVQVFPLVKVNMVLMEMNIGELPEIIRFSDQYAGKLVMKFIELVPNNPVFYSNHELFEQQHVSREEFFHAVALHGKVSPVQYDGDNPNCEYYHLEGSNFSFGLITLHSLNYRCGYCKKIRVSPYGVVGGCITGKPHRISNTSKKEKLNILQELVHLKDREEALRTPKRHYNPKYGYWRFGEANKATQ